MTAHQAGDTVVLGFEIATASGENVSLLVVADAQGNMARPKPPHVKVFDAGGKLIYQVDLQYG